MVMAIGKMLGVSRLELPVKTDRGKPSVFGLSLFDAGLY